MAPQIYCISGPITGAAKEARQGHHFLGQNGNLSQFAVDLAYTLNDDTAFQLYFTRSREFEQTWSELNIQV